MALQTGVLEEETPKGLGGRRSLRRARPTYRSPRLKRRTSETQPRKGASGGTIRGVRHDAVPVEDTSHDPEQHAEGERSTPIATPGSENTQETKPPSATEDDEGEEPEDPDGTDAGTHREHPERAPARAPEPEVAAIAEHVGEPRRARP